MSLKKDENQYDKMTKTPVDKLILKLGIPTTISMLVTAVYNMADTYFVSSLGTSAAGATGVVFGLMAILQAMGFMHGHGAGSIISRKLGAKDIEGARRFSATALYLSLFVAGVVMAICFVFMNPMLRLLGSTETILPYARLYTTCILIAAPAMVSSFVMNNILRYEGKAFFAMIGLTTGGFLNMGLDALFMRGLGMGIEGAGIATAISQYVSAGILLSMFLRGKTQTNFKWSNTCFDWATCGEIYKTGMPSLARQGLGSISTMVLNNAAGMCGGDAAIAAMSIVNRTSMFLFSVALGIGQGFQPVAGFNYGAKQYSRVKRGFFFTWKFGTIFLSTAALLAMFNAEGIIRFFRDDPEVITIGALALKAQCIGLFVVPFGVCNNMLFQSIGANKNATFLSTLRNGIYFIPTVIILTGMLGVLGVQIAQPIADYLTFLTCIPFSVSFFKNLPEDAIDG